MRNVIGLLTVTMVVLVVDSAQASPTANVNLTYGGGTFEVHVSVSTGDNAGLALYKIPLTGFDTLTNVGPMGIGVGSFGVASGFTTVRSGDDVSPLVASQDLAGAGQPDQIVYGFGQTGGTLPAGGLAYVQQNYGAPLLVGQGTYSGAAPGLDSSDPGGIRLVVFNHEQNRDVSEIPAEAIGSGWWDEPLPPLIADAGGPYVINVGDTLHLSAAGSTWPNTSPWVIFFDWDLDGDGGYETSNAAAGPPGEWCDVSYAELEAMGLGVGGPYDVDLRMTAVVPLGGPTIVNYATTTLTIIPEPATLSLLTLGGLALIRCKRRG